MEILLYFLFFPGVKPFPALWHAPIAVPTKSQPEKYPVVIFSHGLGGTRFAYSSVCAEIASNGFIVVALEHRDQSASFTYTISRRDGADVEHPIKYRPLKPHEREYTMRNQQVK